MCAAAVPSLALPQKRGRESRRGYPRLPVPAYPSRTLDEANDDPLTLARLTFARVSLRAQACRDKGCARRRLCLAPLGHMITPTSHCPIMNEEEREAIRAGLAAHMQAMRQFIRASDAAWCAAVDTLPKREREAIYTAARAESATAREDRDRDLPIWDWLWTEIGGDRWVNVTAREASRANAAIIARCGKRTGHPRNLLPSLGEGVREADGEG